MLDQEREKEEPGRIAVTEPAVHEDEWLPLSPNPPPKSPQATDDEPRKPRKRNVAAADPDPTQPPNLPTPAAVPTGEGDGTLSLGPEDPPAGSPPAWPLAVAGALLFGVVIALAGYVTARRSG